MTTSSKLFAALLMAGLLFQQDWQLGQLVGSFVGFVSAVYMFLSGAEEIGRYLTRTLGLFRQ